MKVDESPMPKAGPGQLVVKNATLAINPADPLMHDNGMFVQTWPTILGLDVAGEVVEIGEGVTGFTKGQRVLGEGCRLGSGNLDEAGFQLYTAVAAFMSTPIPDHMSYEDAVVLPLSVSTAAAGLYEADKLALPLPTANSKGGAGTILIWGGSSSVGCSGIQLAKASGLDVISTASKDNFELVKSLGARAVFDYKSSTVVADIVAEVKKGPKVVGCLDCIGRPYSTGPVADILSQLGGGFISSVGFPLEKLPEKVQWKRSKDSVANPNQVCLLTREQSSAQRPRTTSSVKQSMQTSCPTP